VVCVIIAGFYFDFKNIMTAHFVVATLIAGMIGGLAELLPIARLDDNFTQPVIDAACLYGLFTLFGGFS
jgi:hypothetical protein